MASQSIDFLTNAVTTPAPSATGVQWNGGRASFTVVGTFGGATVALQWLGPDGVTWVNVGTETTLTAAGVGNFELPRGKLRVTVTGGSPSGLYATAVGVMV